MIFEVRSPDFDEDCGQSRASRRQRRTGAAPGRGQGGICRGGGPDDWVIGSDSTVTVDGARYSKPRDRDEAAAHLRAFSGRTMLLSSAVALARQGAVDWSHAETARLHVRPLSDDFIKPYLDAEWPDVGYCVGVFRMEGRGVTLFDRVEGSHFTILGMPLLPLLGALRESGIDAVMTSRPYAEVIGDPIEHSLSPAIHSFWLEALGIEASYGRRQVTRAELPAYLAEKRADPRLARIQCHHAAEARRGRAGR